MDGSIFVRVDGFDRARAATSVSRVWMDGWMGWRLGFEGLTMRRLWIRARARARDAMTRSR